MKRKYEQRLNKLKPKLSLTPAFAGIVGGAAFFSIFTSTSWAVVFFGGMLGGLVGLKVALADYRDCMCDWERTKQMVETIDNIPSQERP